MYPEERKALKKLAERTEMENELEIKRIEKQIDKLERKRRLPQVDLPEIIRALREKKRKLPKIVVE
jgi:hypothetical protein